MKQGSDFAVAVSSSEVARGTWDPYLFLHSGADLPTLGTFAGAHRPRRTPASNILSFTPIEYRHIPPAGNAASSFCLVEESKPSSNYQLAVSEQSLIVGTMRAYLGNIAVTPQLEWLGLPPGGMFAIKSEFLVIEPQDGLVYYWWNFLRSSRFLSLLPPGGGGTRPRLDASSLQAIPVGLHPIHERKAIHNATLALAAAEWRNRRRLMDLEQRVAQPPQR